MARRSTRDDDEPAPWITVRLQCGHSIRSRKNLEELKARARRWGVCPKCRAFERRQLVFKFPR